MKDYLIFQFLNTDETYSLIKNENIKLNNKFNINENNDNLIPFESYKRMLKDKSLINQQNI